LPAETVAQSTTCLVVSIPASAETFSYRSGETVLFPDTTFTAATQTTITFDATISAECFTLSPGQTLPTSNVLPLASVTCTTDRSYPGTTAYYTVTSGQVESWLADTTYTANSTFTFTSAPTSYLSCDPVFDFENPATCNEVTPLTWASLALTFVTIQLTWWIFELPLLFKKRGDGGGIAAFLDAVSWTCVRIHGPASAAVIAAYRGDDVSEFARVYYLGMRGREEPPAWTTWKLCTCVLSDLATIVATVITIYQSATLPALDARRFGYSSWMYPSLPVALIGLSLLLGERVLPPARRNSWVLLGFCTVLVISVGAAIPSALKKLGNADDLWYIPVVCYSMMICPFVLLSPSVLPLAVVAAWFSRVGALGLAALDHYAGGQPYCKMPGIGFAVVYMTLGGVAAALGV
ncbi:hypothetical protein BX600DRAFT_373074, partial [Xylariales sp. PMI_506]